MSERQYWGFRIDVNCEGYPQYYMRELERGVLRQGWGHDKSQDLRLLDHAKPPRDQRANIRMFNNVKKDHIVLVPRIPGWDFVTVSRATEDWDAGYQFNIDKELGDYGHQFPAEYVTHFSRHNRHVDGGVRSTLKCRSRYWRMSDYADSLRKLVGLPPEKLTTDEDIENRFKETVSTVMGSVNKTIEDKVHKELSEQLAELDWEYALIAGLKALFPNYEVEKTSGTGEKKHGTDILITMPGPLEDVQYGIAIQVKDWQREAYNIHEAISQIKKAEEGWKEERGLHIVDKVVVVTDAEIPASLDMNALKKDDGVTILHTRSFRRLLRRMSVATATIMED